MGERGGRPAITMQQLFQALTQTSDGAFVIDRRQRIIFWNRAARRILGYPGAEALGQRCYQILGGRDAQGRTLCQRYCRFAVQAEGDVALPTMDVFARHRDGHGCWLNVTTLVQRPEGSASGQVIIHLFRDVSRHKQQQQFVEQVLSASQQMQRGDAPPRAPTPSAPPASRLARLTPRQQEVLDLLANGAGTAEIAAMLTLSPATVRNHIQNILSRLGVHSRLEAIAYFYQHGWSDADE